jgi:hypothetical protein
VRLQQAPPEERWVREVQNDLRQISDQHGGGASNILLVRGNNIATAVTAAWKAFVGGRPVDSPASAIDGSTAEESLWLVAYFGTSHSEPPAWFVQSVEQTGKTLRVSFRKPDPSVTTHDLRQHLIWVPLGKLQAGTYTLELFEQGRNEVTLMRRVTVPAKGS